MVTYRRALTKDAEKVSQYCKKHRILSPAYDETTTVVFIAEDDNGEIVGVSAVKVWYMIEPVISESAHVGNVLLEKAAATIPATSHRCVIDSDKEEVVSQAERTGFVITDKYMTILKRGA